MNSLGSALVSQDERRQIAGREAGVGAAMEPEQEHLLPLPGEGFELAETAFPVVDAKGCVKVRTNCYSVPVKAGTAVQAKVHPAAHRSLAGRRVRGPARALLRARQQQILDLEHYLEVLERKPGALAGSKPLAQWREQGRWPASYDRLWEELMRRQGKAERDAADDRLAATGQGEGLREAADEPWSPPWLRVAADEAAVRYLLTDRDRGPPAPGSHRGGLVRPL